MTGGAGPTISIVIPCRDEADLLPDQLRSLGEQDTDGWVETIVVDDGSTDGTADVARREGCELPGLQVVAGPRRNQAAAANAGLAVATGEAVLFLDGDDEVAPGYLAAMRAALADAPFVAARVDHDALNPPWARRSRPAEQTDRLRSEPQLPYPVAIGASLGVRRDVLDGLGGFDDAFSNGEDTDLCWRAALADVAVTFASDAVVRYRYRAGVRDTFRQAVGYGRGGGLLERRYGRRGRGWRALRVSARCGRLAALVVRVPLLVTRSGRAGFAFRAGRYVGWLETTIAPRRYVGEEALRRIEAGGGSAA